MQRQSTEPARRASDRESSQARTPGYRVRLADGEREKPDWVGAVGRSPPRTSTGAVNTVAARPIAPTASPLAGWG